MTSCVRDQKIGNLCITLKRVSGIAIANGLTTTKAKDKRKRGGGAVHVW